MSIVKQCEIEERLQEQGECINNYEQDISAHQLIK